MFRFILLFSFFIISTSTFVSAQQAAAQPSFKVDYEKFKLPNGLEVIFHIDRSEPVV